MGETTRHDGVDGELFGGDGDTADRFDADQLIRRHHGPFQAGGDSVTRGRNDRQAVGPAVGMIEFLASPDVFARHRFGKRACMERHSLVCSADLTTRRRTRLDKPRHDVDTDRPGG